MYYPFMPEMDTDSVVELQPELLPGETLYWTGRPNTSVIFHKEDAMMIPFSLMWGGFALFWEFGAAGAWGSKQSTGTGNWFFLLWGIPFIVIGQYMIWGRFVVTYWKKCRTFYGVSNKRVLVVQNGFSKKMASAYLENLSTIAKEEGANGIGTLRFTPENYSDSSRGKGFTAWDGMDIGSVPVFADVDQIADVYRLVSDLKEKSALQIR
jgi:hypothetical protein